MLVSSLPPAFTVEEVRAAVREHYGLAVEAELLVGDIGQNFLLQDADGRRYIYKIANPTEGLPILDAQNAVLGHLAGQELPVTCPQVLPGSEGEFLTRVTDGKGHTFMARLLTYLEGTFLADVPRHSPDLLRSVGLAVGSLDRALADFDHPGSHRTWHWDLMTFGDLRRHTVVIADPRGRSLVEHFILQFELNVRPVLPELRRSLIHNDGNDHNLLVAKESDRVTGLIDFGDMVHSCTIFNLAVACAYAMLEKDEPLAAMVDVVAGYHSLFPLTPPEVDVLHWLVCARLSQSVTISAQQQKLRPDEPYLGVTEAPAWELLHGLFAVSPDRTRLLLRETCGMDTPSPPGRDPQAIREIRADHLGPSLSVSYHDPLKVVRGAGAYLFDQAGHRYLDCVNNVCHLGHAHPAVVEALCDQAGTLNTNTRYLHDGLAEFVLRLAGKFPDGLDVCYLVNSGSEANELALRLARSFTGRDDILVLEHGYHGNTAQLVELSHYKFAGPGGGGPGDHTCPLPMPDQYRSSRTAEEYAAQGRAAIAAYVEAGRQPAAFLGESLLGCGGQIVLPDGYLTAVFGAVRAAGGLCIADEVQVGLGRVGSHFSAFETQDVVPDIVTLGKPLGNGHPLAAVITTREVADAFANGMEYFNTFGGNPVSCAVGLAVLDVIEREGLKENALDVGQHLLKGLDELRRHELVGDVRGLGLYLGVELVTDRATREPAAAAAAAIIEGMKEQGVLLSIDGPLHNVLKIKPPIVFSRANADELVTKLDRLLETAALR